METDNIVTRIAKAKKLADLTQWLSDLNAQIADVASQLAAYDMSDSDIQTEVAFYTQVKNIS